MVDGLPQTRTQNKPILPYTTLPEICLKNNNSDRLFGGTMSPEKLEVKHVKQVLDNECGLWSWRIEDREGLKWWRMEFSRLPAKSIMDHGPSAGQLDRQGPYNVGGHG